jgi:hypothetical protein
MAAQDIAIYQPDAQVGDLKLWRVPEEILIEAQQAATALQKRIAGKKKPVIFNGEQYIENDDWQMLAHFFNYAPKIESTEFVQYGEIRGFKAVAVLLNERTSAVVGRGEALCLDEEDNWGTRTKYEWQNDPRGGGRKKVAVGEVNTPLFQLASMAQTRACNKAMSNKLKWVVSLAGYSTTPAEDMHDATLAPKPEPVAVLPTEIRKKEPASTPLAPQSSGTASLSKPAPAAPQRAVSDRPLSPAPPAERPRPQTPNANVRVITDAQARRFFAIRKETGWSDQETKRYLLETFGTEDDHQIPANRYEEAVRWARNF